MQKKTIHIRIRNFISTESEVNDVLSLLFVLLAVLILETNGSLSVIKQPEPDSIPPNVNIKRS